MYYSRIWRSRVLTIIVLAFFLCSSVGVLAENVNEGVDLRSLDYSDSPYVSDGYWDRVYDGVDSSYTDSNVQPLKTYYYCAETRDSYGNFTEDPPEASGKLREQLLYFRGWDINSVNFRNVDSFGIDARFAAVAGITAIDYYWSIDGVAWQVFDPTLITYDDGLQYNIWDDIWVRYFELDLTSIADGEYWVKVKATDANNNTLEISAAFLKDTVAGDFSLAFTDQRLEKQVKSAAEHFLPASCLIKYQRV